MERSELERRIVMLKRFMACTRVMLRADIRNLMSLRSEEDQVTYFDHVVQQHGTRYAFEVVRGLGASIEMERIMVNLLESNRKQLFGNQDTDEQHLFENISIMEEMLQTTQNELQLLKAA